MLKSLKHENILDLKRFIKSDDGYFYALITEFAEESLASILKRNKMTYDQIYSYSLQLINGLEYMHNNAPPIVHGDLKPENILIIKEKIKIIDFGVAKWIVSSNPETEKVFGTPMYWPPEIKKAHAKNLPINYNTKMDIYSYGLILYEMIFGVLPSEKRKKDGNSRFLVDEDWRSILDKTLENSANKRAESFQIKEILKNIWDKANNNPNEAASINFQPDSSIQFFPHQSNVQQIIFSNPNPNLQIKNVKVENGSQIIIYENNDKYEGSTLANKKHGEGKYTFSNGDVYLGDYKNDKMDGKGLLTRKNGDIYNGFFKNNHFNGEGEMKYANGIVYNGEFKDDLKEGQGKLKFPGGAVYTGQFYNNLYHGKGLMVYQTPDSYEGDWIKGIKEGYGVYSWISGAKYEGFIKNGSYEGQKGKYTAADGKVFEGANWSVKKGRKKNKCNFFSCFSKKKK